MKKTDLLKIVEANNREVKFLGEFNKENLPTIGLTSENWRTGAKQVDHKIDLAILCNNLKDGEIFAIGRDPLCNLRPGYENWVKTCQENAMTTEEAESSYMGCFRTISRIHCFIERKGDCYKVYDCSLAGTIIIPQPHVQPQAQTPAHVQPQAQASEEPKKKENLWNKIRKIF